MIIIEISLIKKLEPGVKNKKQSYMTNFANCNLNIQKL